VNWSPNQITFLIDDVGFYTYNPETKDANTWPFDDDQFILLNIAMGGVSGNIDPAFTEGSMVIDYVRVYQSSGSLSNNQYQDNPINLFPNPSKDIIYISTNENIDEIQVYNTIGQLVKTKSKQTNKLEVFDLEPGMYLLKIQIKGQCISKKILVE
jgi:beta-glucanase (GH16 family)